MQYKRYALMVSLLLLMLGIISMGAAAQEATTEPPAPTDPAVEPTQEPTLEPTLTPTLEPTLTPTLEPTLESTLAPTVEPTLEPTSAPTLLPTGTPVEDTLPPEPPLVLIARELFDLSAQPSGWLVGPVWTWTARDAGGALEARDSSDTLAYNGVYISSAAQIGARLTGGSVQISINVSAVGAYTAALDAAGTLTLYRAGVPVLSKLAPVVPGNWHTLRLSAFAGALRASVDGVVILNWLDDAPLPPGGVTIGAIFPEPDDISRSVMIDEFFLWVPEAEALLYPTPTPTPTDMPPTEIPPTDIPPTEVPAEPTIEPTLEATAEPTVEPSPTPDDGKSYVPVIPQFSVGAQSAPNDNFANAAPVTAVPFGSAGTTDGSTVESGEPVNCGFNITATVWFRFTAPAAGTYLFTSAGSAFDTLLAVHRGTQLDNLTLVGCSDDVSTLDRTSKLTLALNAAEVVWVQLGGFNGAFGNYNLAIQATNVAIPRPPVLTAPPTNTITSNTPPLTLGWNAPTVAPVPAAYELQISAVSNFSSIALTQIISHVPPNMAYAFNLPANGSSSALADGRYYWRVRSLNINNQGSAWTAARIFTIDTQAPNPPDLTAPADGSVTKLPRPTLTWKPAPGANRYNIQVDDSAAFDNPLVVERLNHPSTSLPLSATIMPAPLVHGQTYFWRVQPLDVAGNIGVYGSPFDFIVNLMNAPLNGVTIVSASARPTFSWAAAGFVGATYTVQVADDASFDGTGYLYTSPALTTTSHALPAPDAINTPGIYYWRLIVNGAGQLPAASVPVWSFAVTPSAPRTPVLTSPATNAVVNFSQPVNLTWAEPTSAVPLQRYEIQVSRLTNFSVLDHEAQVNYPTTTYTLPPLAPDGRYNWRVRAVNEHGGASPWSAPRILNVDTSAPLPPDLSAPANGAVTNLTRPTLSWKPSVGANRYNIQVDDNADFSSLVLERLNHTTTSLPLSAALLPVPLQHGVTYYWRVQALDAGSNFSGYSGAYSFTVNLMGSPVQDTAFRATAPYLVTFSWAAGHTGAVYEVLLYSDAALTNLIHQSPSLTTTRYTLPAGQGLLAGEYYWMLRVNGQNPPASFARRFAVTGVLPATPVLENPPTGSVFNVTAANITLAWKPVTNVALARYELQVATDSRFTNLARNEQVAPSATTYSLTNSPALSDGTRYWRVRAVNTDGAAGAWSATRTLILDSLAPGIPNLTAPANNSVAASALPRFTWQAVSGAKTYQIRFSTRLDGGGQLVSPMSFNVATTSFTPVGPLLFTTYYWQVRALDAASNPSGWSAIFNVKVTSPANAVPTLNRFTTATPTLSWTPISWAAGYELQVSYRSDFALPLAYATLVSGQATLSHTLTTALPNGTYYWRIRAQRSDGPFGTWSTTGVFTVEVP